MRKIKYQTDLCVVGGGLAGICTAVSAARHGIKVVLVQDRAVLGGNASSEVRMWICGAHGKDNRETGIVEELILENFYLNPELKYPLWDGVLYGKVKSEENITLLLNSSVFDAECDNDTIKSVTAWQSNAETFHIIEAKYFADCSGDSILAPLSNAWFRYGREARSEFNESIAPEVADKKTMGMSCLIQIRETDHKVDFVAPDWAYVFDSEDELAYKDHYIGSNFWWIEIGGEWDCIHDTDKCRDELLKIAYGVWDHMKNKGDHAVDNWELEWVGFLPGKRESRRYVGEYIINQNDVEKAGPFEDVVAYAGWSMDDHFPAGFYYKDSHPTIYHPAPQQWGIPLRALISKNIKNLVFAGRNISVTHSALSSSRVMATCGILGQALGTAVAQAINEKQDIRCIDIEKLQKALMHDDCLIPRRQREVSALSLMAECNYDIVRNGCERGEENCLIINEGDFVEYSFDKDTAVSEIRIVFDSDLNRTQRNMLCCYKMDDCGGKTPATLVKEYDVIGTNAAGDEFVITVNNNHQRFVLHKVEWNVTSVKLIPKSTHGDSNFRIFNFEIN